MRKGPDMHYSPGFGLEWARLYPRCFMLFDHNLLAEARNLRLGDLTDVPGAFWPIVEPVTCSGYHYVTEGICRRIRRGSFWLTAAPLDLKSRAKDDCVMVYATVSWRPDQPGTLHPRPDSEMAAAFWKSANQTTNDGRASTGSAALSFTRKMLAPA